MVELVADGAVACELDVFDGEGTGILRVVLISSVRCASGPWIFASTSLSMVFARDISFGNAVIASEKCVRAGKNPGVALRSLSGGGAEAPP